MTLPTARIAAAEIKPDPTFDAVPMLAGEPKQVHATFDDGTSQIVATYYSDELTFTEAEFVGLTETEARRLHFDRDKEYLQS